MEGPSSTYAIDEFTVGKLYAKGDIDMLRDRRWYKHKHASLFGSLGKAKQRPSSPYVPQSPWRTPPAKITSKTNTTEHINYDISQASPTTRSVLKDMREQPGASSSSSGHTEAGTAAYIEAPPAHTEHPPGVLQTMVKQAEAAG